MYTNLYTKFVSSSIVFICGAFIIMHSHDSSNKSFINSELSIKLLPLANCQIPFQDPQKQNITFFETLLTPSRHETKLHCINLYTLSNNSLKNFHHILQEVLNLDSCPFQMPHLYFLKQFTITLIFQKALSSCQCPYRLKLATSQLLH